MVSLSRKDFYAEIVRQGGAVDSRMFLFGRIFRTVFFGCVFATVFCVSDLYAAKEPVPHCYDSQGNIVPCPSEIARRIASVGYVKEVIATKENTTNKVTSLTSSATNTQYPSALAVYSAVSERVSTSSAANQSMAGKYNVTGTLSVPDLPLPTE